MEAVKTAAIMILMTEALVILSDKMTPRQATCTVLHVVVMGVMALKKPATERRSRPMALMNTVPRTCVSATCETGIIT